MKKSWRERKLFFLRYHYEKLAAAWKNESDDRRLFFNVYWMMIRAVESLPENPDNYVRCAMNEALRKDRKTLDEIASRFAGCRLRRNQEMTRREPIKEEIIADIETQIRDCERGYDDSGEEVFDKTTVMLDIPQAKVILKELKGD